jgi:hypothetical protein
MAEEFESGAVVDRSGVLKGRIRERWGVFFVPRLAFLDAMRPFLGREIVGGAVHRTCPRKMRFSSIR